MEKKETNLVFSADVPSSDKLLQVKEFLKIITLTTVLIDAVGRRYWPLYLYVENPH